MAKNPLKSGFIYALLILTVLSVDIFSGNNGLLVGEPAPNPEFLYNNNGYSTEARGTTSLYNYKSDNVLLIAFMPDISPKNNYADVMTSAFDTYFAEGLAFGESYYSADIGSKLKVLIVTNNDESQVREYLDKMDFDFDMAADINIDMAHSFGISSWNSSSEGSSVYVIDKNNKVTYANYDYKGEGEKLRSVQKEIFTQLNLSDTAAGVTLNDKILMPGDNAIDFDFTYVDNKNNSYVNGKLSDYIGKKNVVLAFYPAPYSVSCMMEVKKFDSYAEKETIQSIVNSNIGADENVEILMVSNSGLNILSKWKDDTKLNNVKLVSDLLGSISSGYSSFNPLGYNNRTLFIIDKSGKISYIDWNYVVDETDFTLVKDHLKEISQK
ncbi:MAG: redoxin domain-containing protein [Ignavibacteria bacterium]